MKELLDKLNEKQIKFVYAFANRFIEQIPYIDESTVNGLNKDYLLKKMDSKILQLVMTNETIKLKNSILKINLEL